MTELGSSDLICFKSFEVIEVQSTRNLRILGIMADSDDDDEVDDDRLVEDDEDEGVFRKASKTELIHKQN